MQQQVTLSRGSSKFKDCLKLFHGVSNDTLNFVCSSFRLYDLLENVSGFKHVDCFSNSITEVMSVSCVFIYVLIISVFQKSGCFLEERFLIWLKFQEFLNYKL